MLFIWTTTSRFAACISRTAQNGLVLDSNIPRHDATDDQGQRRKQLHEEDKYEFDGEDSSDWIDARRGVERVHDAVDGSDVCKWQCEHGKVQEADYAAVEACTGKAFKAAVCVESVANEEHCGKEYYEGPDLAQRPVVGILVRGRLWLGELASSDCRKGDATAD